MAATYTKGSADDTWIFTGAVSVGGDLTVTGAEILSGDVTIGNAVTDSLILGGRLVTGAVTGTALSLGATYLYNEHIEIRANVTDWSKAANFTGAYFRYGNTVKTTSYNLTGMELNVSSDAAVVNLSGLYSETQCKALAAGSTWTKVKGIEANLSLYDQTQTVAVTEAMCFYATIGLGSGYTAYTGIHGIVIETRDGSVGTRTLGSGIVLRNISPAEGTQTFTKGIQVAMAAVTGISLEGAMTTGINFASTVAKGINFTGATIAAGSAYNAAFCIGQRGGTAHTVTLTNAADLHWNPMQFNVIVGGVNPSNTATWNMIYQNVAHATADMANLRLKGADWTFDIQKNIKDVYAFQGEIDFSANAVAVGGEAAVIGLVMNAGSAGVTGALRGAIISMQGTVTSGSAYGLEIRGTMTTSSGVYAAIKANGTPIADYDYGIIFGEESANNQGPTNLFWVPDGSSGDLGPVINNALVPAAAPDGGTMGADACIRVIVNATPYYIPLYNTLHA